MLNFKPDEKVQAAFQKAFEASPAGLDFDKFLRLFDKHCGEYSTQADIQEAFSLISRDFATPGQIEVTRIKEILREFGEPSD